MPAVLLLDTYVEKSLELDLFFLRILREHAFFLHAGFAPRNVNLMEAAACFTRQLSALLFEAIAAADGRLGRDALECGQFVTAHTLEAEQVSQSYTGILVDSSVTRMQWDLRSRPPAAPAEAVEGRVEALNQRAMNSALAMAAFCEKLLADRIACRLHMNLYPSLLEHMHAETVYFAGRLARLRNREDEPGRLLSGYAAFWTRMLAGHAAFASGMADPAEAGLRETAGRFNRVFGEPGAGSDPGLLASAREFGASASALTRDLLGCRVRSVMLPLMADHAAREVNHYIHLMK